MDLAKLDEVNFVTCNLSMRPIPNKNFNQRVFVQRIRYLIDFAFNPDEKQTFGIEGAQVKIFGPDSIYHFEDIDYGIYQYSREDTICPFRYGERYKLQVIFPNGKEATAETVTPMIYFEPAKDTIWIKPDSITSWYYPEWGGRYPLTMIGPHFSDTVKFNIPEGSVLYSPYPNLFTDGDRWNTESFWVEKDTTSTSIIFYTASDSPSVLVDREVSMFINIFHKSKINLRNMLWDDIWPIENLEEISNIEDAYGIFTADGYYIDKSYILAVKE